MATARRVTAATQDVLRRWFSSNPLIVSNVAALVSNAAQMQAALVAGDIPAVGRCLQAYWSQKKIMCDAEPTAVTAMLAALEPLVHGASLAGAGGGGFLIMVRRGPRRERVHARRDVTST